MLGSWLSRLITDNRLVNNYSRARYNDLGSDLQRVNVTAIKVSGSEIWSPLQILAQLIPSSQSCEPGSLIITPNCRTFRHVSASWTQSALPGQPAKIARLKGHATRELRLTFEGPRNVLIQFVDFLALIKVKSETRFFRILRNLFLHNQRRFEYISIIIRLS